MTARILIVCTGNICRSPMAEGLFRAGAAVVGLDAQVASAGSWEAGVPADANAVTAMADRGIDITGHRSHQMSTIDVEAADLVIAMAREHVLGVVGMVPDAFERTFTLKEFVARARATGPKQPDVALPDYLQTVGNGRVHTELLRADASVDVEDPLGKGQRAFDRTADELERLVWAALDLLAGYPPRH